MSLFQRFGVNVPDPTLFVLANNEVDYLGAQFEIDSYDHWVFSKGNAEGLVGLNNGKLLTLQSSVPADAPAFSPSFLTMSTASGKALLSDVVEDASLPAYTVCAIVREPTTISGIKPIFGTVVASPAANNLTFVAGSPPSRHFFASYSGATSSRDTGVVSTIGSWYFVATAVDYTGTSKIERTLIGGSAGSQGSGAGPHLFSGRPIAMGNAYYATGVAGLMDVAEFIVYKRALTLDEMGDVALRRKSFQATLGNTVT